MMAGRELRKLSVLSEAGMNDDVPFIIGLLFEIQAHDAAHVAVAVYVH